MDQTILMHADIHKRAEVHHVAHGALELHADLEVLDAARRLGEHDLGGIVARVAAGLFELRHDIAQGGHAAAQLGGHRAQAADLGADTRHAARRQRTRRHTGTAQ
ncbi:Uncharacterised protein [Collinsella intestinalis]|nr:Uncharacterised protein [Collinsella intestinalis]